MITNSSSSVRCKNNAVFAKCPTQFFAPAQPRLVQVLVVSLKTPLWFTLHNCRIHMILSWFPATLQKLVFLIYIIGQTHSTVPAYVPCKTFYTCLSSWRTIFRIFIAYSYCTLFILSMFFIFDFASFGKKAQNRFCVTMLSETGSHRINLFTNRLGNMKYPTSIDDYKTTGKGEFFVFG